MKRVINPFVVMLLLLSVTSVSLAQGQIELVIYGGFSEPEPAYYVLQKHLQNYERLNPHVTVTDLGRVPDYDRLLAAMIAGTGPDIIKNGVTPMAEYFRQGLLMPVPSDLAAMIRERMFPVVAEGVTYRGDMFGLPVENQLTGLMYNTRVISEKGIGEVPATWSEFADLGRKITEFDADGYMRSPGATIMSDDWALGFMFINSLLSQGSDLLTADGYLNLETPEAVTVLELYAEAFTNAPFMSWDAWTPFHQGNIAFALGFPFSGQWMDDVSEFASAPMPAGPGGFASAQFGHAYGVSRDSENADEAWKLLEYLAFHIGSERVTPLGETMAALGSMPLSTSDIDAPLYRDNWPFYEGFVEASENARSIMYYYENGIQHEWRFGAAIKQVAFEGAHPQQALQSLAARIELEMAEMD